MQRSLVFISRLIVGALFIVSGLIKANDTIGFSYKLEEYFAADVLNWTIFQGGEVGLAMIICVAEILLGVAVLTGRKFVLGAWSLLLMIIFFTFLTGYTAIGNWFFENPDASFTQSMEGMLGFAARDIHYFKDCGCFGDALKLTPWQSFWKDVVLLVFIVILFIARNRVTPNTAREDQQYYAGALVLIALFSWGVLGWGFPVLFSLITFGVLYALRSMLAETAAKAWIMAGSATLVASIFTYYTYAHLPLRDFRPYAIGKNIPDGMVIPEGENPPEYMVIYTMRSKTSGATSEVSSIDYLAKKVWENQDLEIVETSDPVLFKEGYVPPIHDFVLESMEDGSDRTNEILAMDRVVLWISYDISKTDENSQALVTERSQQAEQAGIPVFGLSASLYDEVEDLRHRHQHAFPYLTCDATTLKTVIRSNPGLVVLKNGTVVGKWHHNDIPTFEEIESSWTLAE